MSIEPDHLLSRIPGSEQLSLSERKKWEDVYSFFIQSGFQVFTFFVSKQNSDWLYTCDLKFYTSIFSSIFDKQSSSKREEHFANTELVLIFKERTVLNKEVWNRIKDNFQLFTLGVSNKEVRRYNFEELKARISFRQQISKAFPIVAFLKELKNSEALSTKNLSKTAYALANSWINTFIRLKTSSSAANHFYSNNFELPNLMVFKTLAPSIQALVVLIGQGLIYSLDLRDRSLVKRHLAIAHPVILDFFKKNGTLLISALQPITGDSSDSIQWPNEIIGTRLEALFLQLNELDKKHYQLNSLYQLFKNPTFEYKFPEGGLKSFIRNEFHRPIWIKEIRPSSITDKMIELRSIKSSERLPKIGDNWNTIQKPGYPQHWDLTDNSDNLDKLLAELPKMEQKEFQSSIKSVQESDLLFILNKFSLPIFKFKKSFRKIVPSWNLLSEEKGETLVAELAEWKSLRAENQEKLRDRLNQFGRKFGKGSSLEDSTDIRTISSIQNSNFQTVIQQAAHSQNVFGNYRIQRMKDFGLENQRMSAFKKSIWLDELLAIEKEITPYIQFVKQSFKSALPIRKSVKFNPDRHSTDGVEFDPETALDSRKWIEGNILKTLKVDIKKGDAIQINAFALDASGSMTHDKMRNLFKILTLLINGLEDRKSYDAFHFFSHKFIEGANFTDHYTNKNLVFQILKSVATIRDGAIIYGGDGGTNISEAIRICHDRMMQFERKIISRHSKSTFVKSIFVITDGEPSIGIIDPLKLNDYINIKREKFETEIKGIYLKPKEDESNSFMKEIFGKDQFVETDEFSDAVNEFTQIISLTYKDQRKKLNLAKRRKKQQHD